MFNRRFLWLVILLLLFLIPLLHRMGPTEAFLVSAPSEDAVRTTFEVTELSPVQARIEGMSVTWLDLPDSDQIRVSVLSDRQPLENPRPPEVTQLELEARYGRFMATLLMPLTSAALEDGTRFMSLWLATPTDATRVVISGNLTTERVQAIVEQIARSDAPGAEFEPAARSAVTRLTGPLPGQDSHLAFELAADIIAQRLGGYNARLVRENRARAPQALINSTLDPDQRRLPDMSTFEQARDHWQAAQARGAQRAPHWHSQLVKAAAYDLTVETMLQAPARMGDLSYDTFVEQWEVLFGTQ